MKLNKYLILTTVCVGIALWISMALFTSYNISFSADIITKKNVEIQVFYTENDIEHFNENQSIKKNIKSGLNHLKMTLPIQHVSKFRFDFGTNPGEVILSNPTILGSKDKVLNLKKLKFNQIGTYEISANAIKLISNQNDPFIVFDQILDINPKGNIDWCIFLILLCTYWFIFSKGIAYLTKFKIFEKNSRIDIVFLTVFFVILFIPMLNISDAEKSEQENRMLTVKPRLIYNGTIDSDFGNKFNNWFSDRFFGRCLFTSLYQYLKYFIAPDAGNENILVGKDGWFFYRPDKSLENFANKVVLSEEEMRQGLSYLEHINNWCKKHHKKFYYVIIPDKHRIYGEYYRLVRKLKPDKFGIAEQFIDYIQKNSDIKVMYLRDELLKYKNEGLLYYKKDSHWSDLGAYHGYNIIMDELKKDYNFDIVRIPEWHSSTGTISDLITMLVPQNKISTEPKIYKRPVYKTKAECQRLTKYGHKDLGEVTCRNKQNKYSVFVLRDSFFNWLTPYISDTFNKTKIVWKYNLERQDLDDIDSNYDIIILENVERFIPKILRQKFPNLPKEN
ncbi:MAG: hypothetical protein J6Y85_01765 [Alphaproteobacteria bacterium]|nr:hypothetical protein [Alphaproteobacteria bacterium]